MLHMWESIKQVARSEWRVGRTHRLELMTTGEELWKLITDCRAGQLNLETSPLDLIKFFENNPELCNSDSSH
jgi:hypothetical protein